MSIVWNKFIMDGKVITEGGVEIQLLTDSTTSDYAILRMNQPEAKLTKQDVREVVRLCNQEGFTTLNVK